MIEYPSPTSDLVSARMKRNPKFNTGSELRLRSRLHRRGYRFRVHLPLRLNGLTVRPDVVFSRYRLAVFIDGCFWHSCPVHGTVPKRNVQYWTAKLARNRQRDSNVNSAFESSDWAVVRLWEHTDPTAAVDAIEEALRYLAGASGRMTHHRPSKEPKT
jgi:DNA mismatch endonuclease, patch repair protein